MNDDVIAALHAGVPTFTDLETVQASGLFRELEGASREWLNRNAELLEPYARKWVADPLHQWSRRWEYPFVLARLEGLEGDSFLDGGSGFTFFPFVVAQRLRANRVICVDSDDLSRLYHEAIADGPVEFRRGDLRRLPLRDAEVSAAYSVSVLEHIGDFDPIVDELHRVLAPGGLLIVTFDLSLDGLSDIPLDHAEELIAKLSKRFEPLEAPTDIRALSAAPEVLTTRRVASVDRARLPWKSPFASLVKSAWSRRRLPLARMKNLACYGGTFRRV